MKFKISVIGLGYVGLPLAMAFAKKYRVVGYDIDCERVGELCNSHDRTKEITHSQLASCGNISFTSDLSEIEDSNIYIITVPTPVNKEQKPDLFPLAKASEMVGTVLCQDDLVIYESTVYPGCTEEICLPILEKHSKLRLGDFLLGYSPERINPADKTHTLSNTVKVVSANNTTGLNQISLIYDAIIEAGLHRASSIKVAEASKILENIQRDVNIALMNEFSHLLTFEGIETSDVIDAAMTKWNFLRFVPGLVGGHCIGIDPYYMLHRAEMHSVTAPLISAARSVNERMPESVAHKINSLVENSGSKLERQRSIICLGATFKENCPDFRNTKVANLIAKLIELGNKVEVYDPLIDENAFQREFGIETLSNLPNHSYDAVIVAVPHAEFREMSEEQIYNLVGRKGKRLVADLKGAFGWLDGSELFENIFKL